MTPPSLSEILPAVPGTFIGRVRDPRRKAPVPVLYRQGALWDASTLSPTVSGLLERDDLLPALASLSGHAPDWRAAALRLEHDGTAAQGDASGALADDAPLLLAPVDLQVLKACGVTFTGSMLERVIEERAQGDPAAAAQVRARMTAELGVDLSSVVPGSPQAERAKRTLTAQGWWSQYLEVGLGPDPEVFTKGPVLSAVGAGADIGVPSFSRWSNPEPELVLLVSSTGRITGVTLGNDVNLRDVEGRSALLLGMAKDNNRSTALGPFIRLFDESFGLDDARGLDISLTVRGEDGFVLEGLNSVGALSRSFEELVSAAYGRHHQYPDGFALFTGTLFAPTEDRNAPGEGFTHHLGDAVTIANEHLGALINTVRRTEELPPWTYGIRRLWEDMARIHAPGGAHAQL